MVQNMISLRDNLTKDNIKWEDRSDSLIDTTAVLFGKHTVLVRNGFSTYGGYNEDNRSYFDFSHYTPKTIHSDRNKGLLELIIDGQKPFGNLDHVQAYNLIHRLIQNDSY